MTYKRTNSLAVKNQEYKIQTPPLRRILGHLQPASQQHNLFS